MPDLVNRDFTADRPEVAISSVSPARVPLVLTLTRAFYEVLDSAVRN